MSRLSLVRLQGSYFLQDIFSEDERVKYRLKKIIVTFVNPNNKFRYFQLLKRDKYFFYSHNSNIRLIN